VVRTREYVLLGPLRQLTVVWLEMVHVLVVEKRGLASARGRRVVRVRMRFIVRVEREGRSGGVRSV